VAAPCGYDPTKTFCTFEVWVPNVIVTCARFLIGDLYETAIGMDDDHNHLHLKIRLRHSVKMVV
jgi:hypothetical protein